MSGQRRSLGQASLWFYTIAGALILVALVATVIGLGPLPPRVVVMSTGAPGSDDDLFARRYQTVLKQSGVRLRLLPSAGAVENLRRLNDPHSDVSVAFAQGSLTSEAQSPSLESLGTMFFEPFWFFSRLPMVPRLENLRGRKISIGPEGSGARALALQFLALNGVEHSFAQLLPLPAGQAGEALLHGEIDAAALVSSPDSEVVRGLLASSDVNLVGFPRADAYVALYPYLSKLTLPAAVGNLATNRPPTDVTLVAPVASLIVRQTLHPAIQYLLLEAAAQIHSAPNIFCGELKFVEAELDARGAPAGADLQLRLQRLENRANQIRVPFSFAPFLYQLRHIALVRSRLPQDAPERARI